MKASDIIELSIKDLEKAWEYVQNSIVYDAPVVQGKVDRAKTSIERLKEMFEKDIKWLDDEDFEI